MKTTRVSVFVGGVAVLALAFGFVFRFPAAISIWPWQDGRYSYLFIGSILAAVSAAMLWIGWTGELGALPAGSLNIFVIAVGETFYFFKLALADGRAELMPYGAGAAVTALVSAGAFWWGRRIPLRESLSTPALVKVSFGMFVAALLLAGSALILRAPIFPWKLNPDSSVIFGCIFLGDAFYFLYGLLYPRWRNACGQLLSFLAYDLVLIFPFLGLIPVAAPEAMLNLIVYILILVYSAAIAAYFLFLNPQTRFGS